MLNKNAASTIIGISMGQEICLILGQVSLNLLYWEEKPPNGLLLEEKPLRRIYVVREEIIEKTTDIQAK